MLSSRCTLSFHSLSLGLRYVIVQDNNLSLNLVLSAEHIVNTRKVVDAWCNGRCTAIWRIALLEMSLLSQLAHLEILSVQAHQTF